MATTVWKGHLTFGLISIPMRMSAAARGERISFNQLHNVCHSRLKQPLFCPVCNRNVERSEIVKGHEYEKDQYVLFSEEELDKIEPSSAKVMEILEFVKLDDMDPLYFDSSYYVAPEDAGVKAWIAAKLKGQEVTEVAQPHMAPVIDLMEALKKSLAEKQAPPAAAPGPVPVGKKPPARAVEAISAVQKKGKKVAG